MSEPAPVETRDTAEMHVWDRTTAEELALRRQRQNQLDSKFNQLRLIFLNIDELEGREQALWASLGDMDSQIGGADTEVVQKEEKPSVVEELAEIAEAIAKEKEFEKEEPTAKASTEGGAVVVEESAKKTAKPEKTDKSSKPRPASKSPAVVEEPTEVDKAIAQEFEKEEPTAEASTKEASTERGVIVVDEPAKKTAKPKKIDKTSKPSGAPKFRVNYRAGIRSFRDGNYKLSIDKFMKAKNAKPPAYLRDNIYFGLASAYFKIEKYDPAIKNLKVIVDKYPKGDKWLVSHVMLGYIYSIQGEASKSLFYLEKALKTNPPNEVRNFIARLMGVTQEEGFYAGSS